MSPAAVTVESERERETTAEAGNQHTTHLPPLNKRSLAHLRMRAALLCLPLSLSLSVCEERSKDNFLMREREESRVGHCLTLTDKTTTAEQRQLCYRLPFLIRDSITLPVCIIIIIVIVVCRRMRCCLSKCECLPRATGICHPLFLIQL